MAATINQLAERLEDVETTRRRILGDLAHEMRTPLASIEAHLEAVEDGVRELDDNTLTVLHEGTARLQRLAEDIGAVSRAEEGRLESRPVLSSPQDMLESAATTARDAFDAKGVGLVIEASNIRDQVLVDPQRMAQVLGNLLDNALRHTPHGGTVSLALRRPDPGWVELDVTDTGDGIAPEHLPHLFERFYRADPSRGRARGGSGIGLTISRALVEAHGGGLSVTSSGPGRGSTFTVRLPVAD
jgi:signal transduction histidine kinase